MPLFNNIEQIMDYTDQSIGVNINSLLPIIPEVYRQYVAAFIPKPLYERLSDMSDSLTTTPPSEVIYAQLRKLMQATMAKLIVAQYAQRSEVSLTASGLQRTEGAEQKSGYRYQSSAFVRSYRLAGISALDEMLQLCDQEKDNISEWKDSKPAQRYEKLLIKNGAEFNEYLKLKHPQITFQQLTVDIEDVEFILFSKTFGVNYPILKSRAADGNLEEAEKDLLEKLKRTLAYAAMCRAVPKLAISVEDDGIMSVALDDAQDKSTNKAELLIINKYQASIESTANEYLALSKSAFDTVITNAEASIYVAPPANNTNSALLDNSGFSSVFAI